MYGRKSVGPRIEPSGTPALRIHWRLSMVLETSSKSVWSNVFWHVKVCRFRKCIQYTIHWDKTQILKKFPSDKIKGTKMPSSFFCEFQLITVLLLICNSYMSWSTRFLSLKLCMGFSVFSSISFSISICFFIYIFISISILFDCKTS